MKSRSRAALIGAAIVVSTLFLCGGVWSWGPTGHSLITQHAIQILPKEIKPFYEINSNYVIALDMLPDDWRETHRTEIAPEHFCDLDQLDTAPFDKIRVDRATAEAKFGKDNLLKAGVLPWAIVERYNKLVAAMKANNPEEIVVQSAVLAHYVGDAHVPFHCTKDYDGKKPEEKGLHFRWESSLLANWLKPESINATTPTAIKDPLNAAVDMCVASQSYVDKICTADDAARAKDPNCAFVYYKMMWQDTGDIVQQRLTSGAQDLAGMWIAAWQEAGKPALAEKAAAMYWGH